MNSVMKQAKQNWKLKSRLRRFNQWIFGPVFIVNMMTVILGVTLTGLGDNYQQQTFWEATKTTVISVLQTIGWIAVG